MKKILFLNMKYSFQAVLLLLLWTYFFSFKGHASDEYKKDENYINSLIIKAEELKLYQKSYWHVLLHYKKKLTGYESLIDDEKFFLSKDGKNEPGLEMEATIRSFFKPEEKDKLHPSMKFIARYSWLREQLNISPEKLPFDPEKKFSNFLNRLKPENAYLIFPAGYVDSPASMFGHTLLIIDDSDNNRLTAQAINYAAITNENFGPLFAVKGLLGSYKGYFSFLPYYEKIKEYNNGEMRDIWEYHLNLSKDEVERLVKHMVELEGIYSYYYFLGENCAYNLLFLLEAARPGLSLTDKYSFTVEPVDTIRTILSEKLVDSKEYRPSLYSKIKHYESELDDNQTDLVIATVKGEKDIKEIDDLQVSFRRKSIMYDLSSDYLQFLYTRGEISLKDYNKRFFSILKYRSGVKENYNNLENIKTGALPEDGHYSRKITIGGGYRDDQWYSQLKFRLTCHDFMDMEEGFTKNSHIIFGNMDLRYYHNENRDENIERDNLRLHSLDLIDVFSLPASDKFYMRTCWKFKTGIMEKYNYENKENLAYYVDAGGGVSTELSFPGQIYFLAGVDNNFAGSFEYNSQVIPTVMGGFVNDFFKGYWKLNCYGKAGYQLVGKKTIVVNAAVEQRIKLWKNASLSLNYRYKKIYDVSYNEYNLGFNLFF